MDFALHRRLQYLAAILWRNLKFLNTESQSRNIEKSFEFLHNSKLPANFWQDPASIDIQWVATIECQYWQDPARNWQELTNYAKTRLNTNTKHNERSNDFK